MMTFLFISFVSNREITIKQCNWVNLLEGECSNVFAAYECKASC